MAALVWTAAAGAALAQPTVTSVSPPYGIGVGGEVVTITGTGFLSGATVLFGSTPATNVVVNDPTSITVTAPASPLQTVGGITHHAPGFVEVSVTVNGQTGALAYGFNNNGPQPGITSVSPSSGPAAGGSVVVITGSWFADASAVQFGGGMFEGGTLATSFTVDSNTQITATVPPGTGTVDVFVYNPTGTPNCPCQGAVAPYSYIPTPATSGISPGNGPAAGGTVVTLTGTGFTGATAVSFGVTPATSFTVNSDTSITATSPAGSGTVSVTVTAPGGTSGGYAFRYGPPQDSIDAELVQDQLSPIVIRTSGRAITGAVMKGIALGFANGGPTANIGLGAESAFLAYAPEAAVTNAFDGFDGPGLLNPAEQWSLWLDVQGSGLLSGGSGQQLNLTGGIGYRLSEDFIAGIIGGQESFSYSAGTDGLLSGSGLSAGGYVAWQFSEDGMLDAALVGTALDYEVSSGTATGQFDASRWLVTSGLTGEFELSDNLTISPSARVTALWESQEGWTDSLATDHAAKAFSDGTASGGVTFSGQWLLEDMSLLPYFGLFADYRFEGAEGTTTTGLEGRVQAGVRLNVSPSAAINLGGELGGLGSEQRTWSLNAGVSGGF